VNASTPTTGFAGFCAGLTRHPWFKRIVILTILLAGILAGLETDTRLRELNGPLLRLLDTLVLVVFIGEILLKLCSHGRHWWRYFRDGWNVFDFLIVTICCLPIQSHYAAVLRLARVLRVLRLVSALPRLQMLVGALLKSLGAMGYVALLLGLMFYIYAVAGVQLFGRHAEETFGSLPRALQSLFQMITLDNWSELFGPVRDAAPLAASIYFVSFILLGTMIMLNLFIGIIMNSMAEMHAEIEARESAQFPAQPPPESAATLADISRKLSDLQRSVALLGESARSQNSSHRV
jgi:voltage-gated sodium channel